MNFLFTDRIVLITGGSKGIGRTMAEAFVRENAHVIICARGKFTDVVKELPAKVTFYTVDARKSDDVEKVVSRIKKKFGKIDILINNVGEVGRFGGLFDLTDNDWRNAYDINFLSAVFFSRAAVPLLRMSDCGRIINMSSIVAHQPGFLNPHYGASKAAMLHFNKYLALFLGKDNILVNAICPSAVKEGIWNSNVQDRANRDAISLEEAANIMEQEESKKSPLGKMPRVDDIINLVFFLSSPLNMSITGSFIDIDAGIRRGIR